MQGLDLIELVNSASTPLLAITIFILYKIIGVLQSINARLIVVETKLEEMK